MSLIDSNTMTGIQIPFGGFSALSTWATTAGYCCDAIEEETYRVTGRALAKRGIELQGNWNTTCRYSDSDKYDLDAIAEEINEAMNSTSEFECDCDF